MGHRGRGDRLDLARPSVHKTSSLATRKGSEARVASRFSHDRLLMLGIVCIVALNVVTFAQAYPETFRVDSGCCSTRVLAKDFSAYYVGAWRLFHDPANVYTSGAVPDGGPVILPQPESFKYLPSFLLVVSPLLLLPYQAALVAFDLFQLLLVPAIAFLTYRLVRAKGAVATLVVTAAVLLQPSPSLQWGLSVTYFWQWGEGQSKVLETFLLVLSFYLGSRSKPALSGASLGVAAFDPRFVLISVPVFCVYNRGKLWRASVGALLVCAASNAPLVIPGVAVGFAHMVWDSGLSTPFYYYSYIPLAAVVCFTALNARAIARMLTSRKEGSSPSQGL